MKKTGVLTVIVAATVIITAFSINGGDFHSLAKYSSGGPVGYAGDPASGNKDCSHCHTGTEVETVTGWITSDIPESGYLPNTTYTITATATGDGITKFGYQVSPQSSDGTFQGLMASLDDQSKPTTNINYMTHTAVGTAGDGTRSWSFEWISPDAGSGELSFYGAFNLTNANGSTSGDVVKLSSLTVTESASGIALTEKENMRVFPNPASQHLIVVVERELLGAEYTLSDISGREWSTGIISHERSTLQVSDLAPGMYFIQIGSEDKRKILVVK